MELLLHEAVLELSLDIVDASEREDTEAVWTHYQALQAVCERNENTERNHPLQWEVLADCTPNMKEAIALYNKALECAEALDLAEYIASVKLALSERYLTGGDKERAYDLAFEANEIAKDTTNLELRVEISDFLLTEFNNSEHE